MSTAQTVIARTAITLGRTTFRLLPWCQDPSSRQQVYRADGIGAAGLLTYLYADNRDGRWSAYVEHQLSEEPGQAGIHTTWTVGHADSPEEAAELTLRVRYHCIPEHGHIWIATNLGHAATLDAHGSLIEIVPADYLPPQYEGLQRGRPWYWMRDCPPLSPLAMSTGCPIGAALSGWCDSQEQAMAEAAASWARVRDGVAAAATAFGLRIAGSVS